MKYVFLGVYNKVIELNQSTNMSEAIKEALVYKIMDYWNLRLPTKPINFNNFDTWLINWLKSTRYWDMPEIHKNVEKSKRDYPDLKENIIANLRLFEQSNNNKIYEVSEERSIENDLRKMEGEIVGEAVLREINKIQEEEDKKEYARLKEKFEKVLK